jgi:hypothetical protein
VALIFFSRALQQLEELTRPPAMHNVALLATVFGRAWLLG